MNNLKYQEICVNELVNVLNEELELENPNIPEVTRFLLVEFMAWDIFYRGGYKPVFDSKKSIFEYKKSTFDICNINKILKNYQPQNKEIVLGL